MQTAADLHAVPQIRERRDRVGKEHHAEARENHVTQPIFEGMSLGVRMDELDVHTRLRRPGLGGLHHQPGHIHPHAPGRLAQAFGHSQRGRPGTAAHIQHLSSRLRQYMLGQPLLNGPEHLIEQCLRLHPGLTTHTVPELLLLLPRCRSHDALLLLNPKPMGSLQLQVNLKSSHA